MSRLKPKCRIGKVASGIPAWNLPFACRSATALPPKPNTPAMDYVRGGLVNPKAMKLVPPDKAGADNDLKDLLCLFSRMVFTLQVFFPDNQAHWFFVYFTLHPANDIEVGKCPSFKTVLLKFFDLL